MTRTTQTPYLGLLLLILLFKAVLITLFVIHGDIGLGPDEAQYWTWSQQLDWGYYSKPPGIAWQIALGCEFFGNTVLGVRIGSIVIGILLPLAVYLLAHKSMLKPQTAFWGALILGLSPLGMVSSMLAITDVGMILFWTLGCAVIAAGLSRKRSPDALLLGLCILCGALFKWPIYLLWPLLLMMMPFYPFIKSRKLILGFLLSLLGLLPSFLWNMQHDWVTLRHVAASINGSPDAVKASSTAIQGNVAEFLGAQAALLSPIFFVLMVISLIAAYRRRKDLSAPIAFCALTTFSLLSMLTLLAIFKKIQGNWGDYIYPTGIILIAWLSLEVLEKGMRWLYLGIVLSLLLVTTTLSLPAIQTHNLFSEAQIPYKINPFKHNVGWDRLPAVLLKAGYRPDKDFLFSSKYQTTSILSFYGPEQKRAYFLNLFGIRKNQFSFWPQMSDEQIGKDGYYLIIENEPHIQEHLESLDDYTNRLSPYFESVEFICNAPLFYSYGKPVKNALIFKCNHYNGKKTLDPDKY